MVKEEIKTFKDISYLLERQALAMTRISTALKGLTEAMRSFNHCCEEVLEQLVVRYK